MPDVAKESTEVIIGRGLIAAESIAQELRERLIDQLAANYQRLPASDLLGMAREILSDFEPLLAEALADTDLAAWIRGLEVITVRTPQNVLDILAGRVPSAGPLIPPGAAPPAGTGTSIFTAPTEEEPPRLVFPRLIEAANDLIEQNVVTRDVFGAMNEQSRSQAFTVANVQSQAAISRIRDTLVQSVQEGWSLDTFRDNLESTVETSRVGPSHLENVYRTNTQAAFSAGQESLLNNPVMRTTFPYSRYNAIDDGRVRPEHFALETLGLNGTNIYRTDDPMWQLFTPPWGFNCRCSKTAMTLRQAANAGVEEARRWLRTGEPPERPEHRLSAIPFRPQDGFVGPGARIARLGLQKTEINEWQTSISLRLAVSL